MLDPVGPSASAIAQVWWWMLGVSVAVVVFVMAAAGMAMYRTRFTTPQISEQRAQRHGVRWMLIGGVALPVVAIGALLVMGSSAGYHQLPLPWRKDQAGAAPPLRVQVLARQWAWEVAYPEIGTRRTDELRIPVGREVDIHVTSADVIHSFWVPRLGGKIDAIPGRTNVVRLRADAAGVFRGQCAEFCGLRHAHMALTVVAMPAEAFERWQAEQSLPAAAGEPR